MHHGYAEPVSNETRQPEYQNMWYVTVFATSVERARKEKLYYSKLQYG